MAHSVVVWEAQEPRQAPQPSPVGPAPVVVLGKFTVTNTASGTSRFYELRKP